MPKANRQLIVKKIRLWVKFLDTSTLHWPFPDNSKRRFIAWVCTKCCALWASAITVKGLM